MQINNISNQSFCGKIAKTDLGNEYEKSNDGKKYGILANLGITGTALVLNKAVNGPKSSIILSIFFSLLSGLIFGAITDHLINKSRKKIADKFAVKKELPEDTNKGKKVCGAIGVGFAALYPGLRALSNSLAKSEHALKNIKEPMLPVILTSVLSFVSWLVTGTIYDNSVNKFKNKLQTNNEQ